MVPALDPATAPTPPLPDLERQTLLARLASVRRTLAEAARTADESDAKGPVRLLAASKLQPAAAVCALYDAGVQDFAENYVRELVDKARAVASTGRRPRWHLVGQLQRNKVAAAASVADCVQSLDGPRLLAALARVAAKRAAPLEVLVQVNLDPEPAPGRGGCPLDACTSLAAAVLATPKLRLCGLMGVAPQRSPARAAFARLAALGRAVRALPGGADARVLSMGMSHDFADAVAEGATMVRIGTALFGPRPPRKGQQT